MKTERCCWTKERGWSAEGGLVEADWVLYFAAPEAMETVRHEELRRRYPKALLLGCTTGGEIVADDVQDGTVSVMAVKFDSVSVRGAEREIADVGESFGAGEAIGAQLGAADLRAVFVLSDGTRVNGTELVRGLRKAVGDQVVVSGGLAGDGARFGSTRTGLAGEPASGVIGAVGLYGAALQVGHGSAGGWVPFGPERRVTRAEGNVLYELDGQPALDLYKHYLGEEASKLPASALLYPLIIRRKDQPGEPLVRTILGIDAATNAMTFAGDMPEGAVAQLMRASLSQLVDGAASAAESAQIEADSGFAVLVSCIGRKLLMGQRTCDEVDAAANVLGTKFPTVGFYSYGEIAPCAGGFADLHNQTMTITTFAELAA
jgi:hypothetical protein